MLDFFIKINLKNQRSLKEEIKALLKDCLK